MLCSADRPRLGQRQARGVTLRRLSEVPVGQSRLQILPGGSKEGIRPATMCSDNHRCSWKEGADPGFPPPEASTTRAGKTGLSFESYLHIRCSSAGVPPAHRSGSPTSGHRHRSGMTQVRGLGNCDSGSIYAGAGSGAGLELGPGAGGGAARPAQADGSLRGRSRGRRRMRPSRTRRRDRSGRCVRGLPHGASRICRGTGAEGCGPSGCWCPGGRAGTRLELTREPAPSRGAGAQVTAPHCLSANPGPPRRLFLA